MYDGAADVFEFAQKEYGLGKSTVSRFIAINEKFSEGGNSLKLKQEFWGLGSSKLSEMLTLPDEECLLITEKTTVKEIRELKEFIREEKELEKVQPVAETVETEAKQQESVQNSTESEQNTENYVLNPVIAEQIARRDDSNLSQLQKLMVSYFENLPELLNAIMDLAFDLKYKDAMELMNPSGNKTYNKGIVFLFMYSWEMGIKYRIMGQPGIFEKTWEDFISEIYDIYAEIYLIGQTKGGVNTHKEYYSYLYQEKVEQIQQNQGFEGYVATSQQTEKTEEKREEKQDESTVLDMEKIPANEKDDSLPGAGGEAARGSEGIMSGNQLHEDAGSVQEESGNLRQMENQGRETASDNQDSNKDSAGYEREEPHRASDGNKELEAVEASEPFMNLPNTEYRDDVKALLESIDRNVCIPFPDKEGIQTAIQDCKALLEILERVEARCKEESSAENE